jgi:hypothetical protein
MITLRLSGDTLTATAAIWYPQSPPDALMFLWIPKGSDLYLYHNFPTLGLEVEIRPVLVKPYSYNIDMSGR